MTQQTKALPKTTWWKNKPKFQKS